MFQKGRFSVFFYSALRDNCADIASFKYHMNVPKYGMILMLSICVAIRVTTIVEEV